MQAVSDIQIPSVSSKPTAKFLDVLQHFLVFDKVGGPRPGRHIQRGRTSEMYSCLRVSWLQRSRIAYELTQGSSWQGSIIHGVEVGRLSQVVGYQESQIFATFHSLHWAPKSLRGIGGESGDCFLKITMYLHLSLTTVQAEKWQVVDKARLKPS